MRLVHEIRFAKIGFQLGFAESQELHVYAFGFEGFVSLAEVQAASDSGSAAQAEADRLAAELEACKAELAAKSDALDSATAAAQDAASAAATELEEARTKLANCEGRAISVTGYIQLLVGIMD